MPVDPFAEIGMKEMEERRAIMDWLREDNPARLALLWRQADAVRKEFVGDEVHLRGLIELSNCCVRQCAYCGLRSGNSRLDRYRMNAEEVFSCASDAERMGLGTVVLQAAEDYGLTTEWIASIIRRIKDETPLAVTLSLGERPESDLAAWREAGADRYFLRFETSDPWLYRSIHPTSSSRAPSNRIELLRKLQMLGYQTGSGIMIGIPGQTYTSVVEDILLFRALDLDMIGVGPYLPNPATPMGCGEWKSWLHPDQQVPNSEVMTCKVVALSRLCCPEANIPSTTALATLNSAKGYELGLARGANVIMPGLTPYRYRTKYEIYPKQLSASDSNSVVEKIHSRIKSIDRAIGKGPGGRIRLPEGADRPVLSSTNTWRPA